MTTKMNVGIAFIEQKRLLIDHLLDKYLPAIDIYPNILHEAMRYSVLAGGKRIRPILALTTYELFGGKDENKINLAAVALEFVHTYSLIHDDLPCMDDDDLRRGMPTLHKKYDEATAVLAGDALHDLAFSLISQTGSAETVRELADAIGTFGMIGGQVADVEAEGKHIELQQVLYIHSHKTGALIRACIRIGAILAGIEGPVYDRLSLYGEKIGLAFQIIDDILDIKGDQKKLGKMVGSDCKNKKATYPGITGLKQAQEDADKLIDEAVAIAEEFGFADNHLKTIAYYIGQREY
jgi:geranylgeranyl diphosphate synthase type II